MSKSTSFTLGDHVNDFVEAQIDNGRYQSASEVVRAGLRLLEEHETSLAALRTALIEGEQSGQSPTFDVESFISDKRKGVAASR